MRYILLHIKKFKLIFIVINFILILSCNEDKIFKPLDSCNLKKYCVVKPNGGEQYFIGDTIIFEFEGTSDNLRFCEAEKSIKLNDKIFYAIDVENDIANCKKGFWKIPDSITYFDKKELKTKSVSIISNQCSIKINEYNNETEYDISDGTFKISKK